MPSETPAHDTAPEGSVPAPRKRSGGEHSVMSSESAPGHQQSMNRMPDPNVEWTNEESGEGKG